MSFNSIKVKAIEFLEAVYSRFIPGVGPTCRKGPLYSVQNVFDCIEKQQQQQTNSRGWYDSVD